MRIFVTGGSGVLGRALVARLVRSGHHVTALAASPASADVVRGLGAVPVAGDLLAPATIGPISADVVVHMATSIPRADTGTGSWEANDRIRVDGTRSLVAAARAGGVRRIVGYSVIWVYGDQGDAWVTESTPIARPVRPEIRSAVVLEELVRSSGAEWVVVRGGHLYGPGTGTTEQMLSDARAGALRIDGPGDAFDSLVHADDTAQGVELAAVAVPGGVTLNVVDDVPLRQRDVVRIVSERVAGPPPRSGPPAPGWGSLRVSNALARSYGFRPRYPDLAAGLASVPVTAEVQS